MCPDIRDAHLGDLDSLCLLLKDLFSLEKDFSPDIVKQHRGLKLFLEDKKNRIIKVALSDNKVVGMVSAQLLVSTAQGSKVALIEDMVIQKNFRRQGLGTRLLLCIEKWCLSKGATRIQLLADEKNVKAHLFYSKANWQATSLQAWRKFLS